MEVGMNSFRSFLIITATIILCFILQCSVFPALSFSGIGPNLMIIVAVSYGFMLGDVRGMVVGLFCGLLCDVFFGQVIGLQMLLYSLLAFLCGKFERLFYVDDIKLPILLILVSDFLYGFLSYVFQFLIHGRFFLSYFLVHYVLPEMVYTLLCAVVLYPLLLHLFNRFIRKRRESETNSIV